MEWIKNAVFYNIYPQSFYDTNNDGIGDLKGIIEKLDYIKYMDYDAIWLNPFYESPFRDAGYDVTDFYKVAPRYGTNDDFKELCKMAHSKNIKVIVDIVAGHTSTECEWFKKSATNEKNEYTNRYIWTNSLWDTQNSKFVSGFFERDGCYMKNFFASQPALNYGFARIDYDWQLPIDHPDCKATKDELIKIIEYWFEMGSDGIRVDMARTLIKNDDEEKTEMIKFWQEVRKICDDKYPEKVLISEWGNPPHAIRAGFHIDFLLHHNKSYASLFRAEKGRNVAAINNLDIKYSFFNKEGKGNINDFLDEYLKFYKITKGKGYISMITGNHDMPRIALYRTQEELELVFAFILTMPGIPFVYYGDEIGMAYNKDLSSKEGGSDRTGSRTPMQWNNTENAGFSKGHEKDLYIPINNDYKNCNVAAQMADGSSLLNAVRELIRIKKSYYELQADAEIEFLCGEEYNYPLIYRREKGNSSIVVAINPTGVEQKVRIQLEGYENVKSNNDIKYDEAERMLTMGELSYVIIKEK